MRPFGALLTQQTVALFLGVVLFWWAGDWVKGTDLHLDEPPFNTKSSLITISSTAPKGGGSLLIR